MLIYKNLAHLLVFWPKKSVEDLEILKNDHKDKTKKGGNIETGDYVRCGLVSIGRTAALAGLSEQDMIRQALAADVEQLWSASRVEEELA